MSILSGSGHVGQPMTQMRNPPCGRYCPQWFEHEMCNEKECRASVGVVRDAQADPSKRTQVGKGFGGCWFNQ